MIAKLRNRYDYLPKDFVETECGLFFAVLTFGSEAGGIVAQLRYRQTGNGLKKLNTTQATEHLRTIHPEWLVHCPHRDVRLMMVAEQAVVRHHQPETALLDLLERGDPMLNESCKIFDGCPDVIANLGITGSRLIGAAGPSSDIDLVIFGSEPFAAARRQLAGRLESDPEINLSQEQWRAAYERRGCSIDFQDYLWHERRKHNKFSVNGTKVDISCVAQPPVWLTLPAKKLHRVEIEAAVRDATRTFENPAIYEIDHTDVDVVVCFTPTYAGQALEGERIRAAGYLELAADGQRRLLIGSSRESKGEFLVVSKRS